MKFHDGGRLRPSELKGPAYPEQSGIDGWGVTEMSWGQNVAADCHRNRASAYLSQKPAMVAAWGEIEISGHYAGRIASIHRRCGFAA
jgi:hypothetical protein